MAGGILATLGTNAPLQTATLSKKEDLIVGDHVIFFNHITYDPLIAKVGGVWRLENAIVIDKVQGKFRFQGHGYPAPVTEDALLDGMIRQYNLHVDQALGIVKRIDYGKGVAKAAAEGELSAKYPNVERKLGGGWQIKGKSNLCPWIEAIRDLKHLTRAEAPGLVNPCNGAIEVRRPAEKR
ncbi:MAG TPA: hypothetical protein VGI19_13505, partial [Candidatus Cybelea sp.]|jgi:hypothetical protein